MSNQFNNIKKCSKCNIEYNQDFGPSCSNEFSKQRRIFNKNGKHFCFNCLASEYNINCQYCHKRINSKEELAYWGGGVIAINGDYDYCKADDRVFTCLGCDEKIRELQNNGVRPSMCSGWGPILFPENRKCRIAGCSQKPYYECVDLCLPHSKPCKGGKIKPDGRRCSAAMGIDEGDICEFCQNQTETHQQREINSPKNNPTTLAPQLITNSNDQNDNSVKDKSSEGKREVKTTKFEKTLPKSTEKLPNERDNQALIINLKAIKKITLTSDNNLVIEFNVNDKSETQIITNKQITNSQELQKAKNYLQKENKNSISQQEFNSLINTNSTTPTSTEKPKNNYALLIGGGMAVLVVGVVIGLLVRNRVKKSKLKR